MNKQLQLAKLAEQIEHCTECKKDSTGVMVFGEGSPTAKIMFVGEAPGKQEAATGRPFIGRSGKLLRSLIVDSGLQEDEVYITSPVKYLPERGTPSSSQISHAKEHFAKQVALINPQIMVLMGNVAIQGALGEKIPIKQHHGTIIEHDGRKYFLTFHPAAALRFPPLKKEIEADFAKLKNFLNVEKTPYHS